MLYNLKITLRNLKKNRLYSIINIAGLAVSLAVCSFILLWVQDERSYDRFHKDADEIYMGVAHIEGTIFQVTQNTTGLFAPEAKENFTSVKSYCRIRSFKAGYVYVDDISTDAKGAFVVDSTFFSFFNFPLVTGSAQTLFHNPDEVVISEKLKIELFGNGDPMGKAIRIKTYDKEEKIYYVAAVMKDFPSNTWLPRADLVIEWKSDPDNFLYANIWNSWGGCEFLSFIRVNRGTDIQQLAKEITNLQTAGRDYRHFTLQPLVNLHLYTLAGEPAGIKTVWIFSWIACAILVISCINYVNLVTGRSAKRNHEVGLKKILGARKSTLFFQLMIEAVVLFMIALVVAILLNILFAGIFNHLSGKDIYSAWSNWNIWILYGLMFLAILIFAGIYPALSISSFKLLDMLQRKLTNKGNNFFRRSLIVVQFIASIVLIAATVTLESQLTYIRRKNLGFDQEYVFTCQTRDMAGHYQAVKAALMQNPAIRWVDGASERLSDLSGSNTTKNWEGKIGEGSVSYNKLYVDSTFIKNMAMEYSEGTGFGPGEAKQYIINETATKAMGLTEPIVGKWMEADFGIRGTIVGVVKDFHYQGLYKEIAPLVIFKSTDWANTLYVRTTAKDAGQAIAAVEKLWKQYNPKYVFTYSFMDESFEQLYRADIRTGRLFGLFSFIAILISCMGLFGLVTYTAEAKYKEIGIRKVLGASVRDIVTLLLKEFAVLIGIAMLIAFPLAYYWLDSLLQDFAYRISIGWQIFVLTGVITMILTLLTVGWKAFKAASANPVDAIKME